MGRMFSFVVPIYNAEKYIHKCITSILNQVYDNFEVILVDDGSPDNCPQICDEYARKDNRIKVIHQINSGVVAARKAGVSVATGDYIVCIDGDDWIDEYYLSEFAAEIKKSNPDIVCCAYYHAKGGNNLPMSLGLVHRYYDREKIENELFPYLIEDEKGRYFPSMLWAKAIRTSLFKKNQMERYVRIGEDQACIKPCVYNASSLCYIDRNLYYYRINKSSATKAKSTFSWDDPKTVGQVFSEKFDLTKFDFQAQVFRFVVHNLFVVACSQFNSRMSYQKVKKNILENISDPFYQAAINNCIYGKTLKSNLALFSLKKRIVFLMYVYNKLL